VTHWLNWGIEPAAGPPCSNGRCQAQHPATWPSSTASGLPCLYYGDELGMGTGRDCATATPTAPPHGLEPEPNGGFSSAPDPCWVLPPIILHPVLDYTALVNVRCAGSSFSGPCSTGTTACSPVAGATALRYGEHGDDREAATPALLLLAVSAGGSAGRGNPVGDDGVVAPTSTGSGAPPPGSTQPVAGACRMAKRSGVVSFCPGGPE